jgi:hypothetical protein
MPVARSASCTPATDHAGMCSNVNDEVGLEEVRVGDAVLAEDGELGRVDRIIRAESRTPVYLVVAAGRTLVRRYPLVPAGLVTGVDRARHCVHVRGRRRSMQSLPEHLPLVL